MRLAEQPPDNADSRAAEEEPTLPLPFGGSGSGFGGMDLESMSITPSLSAS